MHKKIIGIVLGMALIAPAFASAQTNDLQTLINTLNEQIAALQQKIRAAQSSSTDASSTTPSSNVMIPTLPCLSITHSLGVDDTDADTGGDVTRLQQFLAQDLSIYPEGRVTGYFGPATMRAVQRWQAQNGVVSSGDPDSTGYGFVGSRTRTAMQRSCNGGGGGDNDFSATPTSGSAPLSVTFSISPQFSGGTLDYGDGSSGQIPAPSYTTNSICPPQGYGAPCRMPNLTLTHTYVSNGTYRATLSQIWQPDDQALDTTCQGDCGVIVSAANTAVRNGRIKMITIVVGTTTNNDYGFTVSVSGNTATFSVAPQDNQQPQDFSVAFGDGSNARLQQGCATGSDACRSVWQVSHTYAQGGTYTATLNRYIACLYASPRCMIAQPAPLASVAVNIGSMLGDTLNASPVSGSAPLQVQFSFKTVRWSGHQYSINYGDGANDVMMAVPTTCLANDAACLTAARIFSASHTYATAGSYAVSVVSADPCPQGPAGTITMCQRAILANATITVTGTSDKEALTANPSAGIAPLSVTFSATNLSVGARYFIDFGDGASSQDLTLIAPPCAFGIDCSHRFQASTSHTYTTTGIYTVALKIACPSNAQCLVGPQTIASTTVSTAGASNPPILTINSPGQGLTVAQNAQLRLSWSTQNAPANSAVAFWLQAVSGSGYGRITQSQPTTGTYDWTVPDSKCDANGICQAIADYPGVWSTRPGTFQIIGKLYTPASANLGGGLLAPSPDLLYATSATSSIFTITAAQSTGAPSVSGLDAPTTLNVGQAGTWTVRASASANSQLSYSVVWGDEQQTLGYSAAQSSATVNVSGTFTHAYQNAGTYTPRFTVSNSAGSAQTSASVVVGTGISGCGSFGCAPTTPDAVAQKYTQLLPVYGNSIGVFISRCVRNDINDVIFTLTGSGGFAGITYYYNASGTLLGSVSFSDTPPYLSGLAPVDTSRYQCTQVRSSRG